MLLQCATPDAAGNVIVEPPTVAVDVQLVVGVVVPLLLDVVVVPDVLVPDVELVVDVLVLDVESVVVVVVVLNVGSEVVVVLVLEVGSEVEVPLALEEGPEVVVLLAVEVGSEAVVLVVAVLLVAVAPRAAVVAKSPAAEPGDTKSPDPQADNKTHRTTTIPTLPRSRTLVFSLPNRQLVGTIVLVLTLANLAYAPDLPSHSHPSKAPPEREVFPSCFTLPLFKHATEGAPNASTMPE